MGEGHVAGAEKKSVINPELWQACAGPLVNLPPAGTHVVYFPQGHSEQVSPSPSLSLSLLFQKHFPYNLFRDH